jgi:hypothetical protein
MKRFPLSGFWILAGVCLLGMMAYRGNGAAPEPLWVKVQLIWGTDEEKSPDSRHKAIEDDLSRKLSKSPFKWKHYFEVNRQLVALPLGEAKNGVKVSSHCAIDLKSLGKDKIETKLYGKGKLLSTHKETVKKDWPLILAGNAENETAWLVVITKIDAPQKQTETPVTAPK